MKIYFDMDGVLADFDKQCLRYGIVNKNDFIHRPRSEWTPEEIELDRKVVAVMREPEFWTGIPLMSGARALVAYADVKGLESWVLTARPNDPEAMWVGDVKRQWLTQYFGTDLVKRTIVCLRSEKAQYAPGNILVDDMLKNCKEWAKAGGTAVRHTGDWEAVLDELDKVLSA